VRARAPFGRAIHPATPIHLHPAAVPVIALRRRKGNGLESTIHCACGS
jgi:hypothetical protein